MKMKYILVCILTIMAITSCNLDEKIAFNIDYDSEAVIPSTIGINLPFDIPIPPIKTNINKELESNNSNKDYLNTAKIKELIITILDPENQTLDFIKDIEIYIKADDLVEIKIAEKTGISNATGKTLTLDVFSEKNIAEYTSN